MANMLIIGKGSSNAHAKQIKQVYSPNAALELYGESELYNACKIAFDFGVQDVFLANSPTPQDTIDIVNILRDYDFTYIVPVNIFLSYYFHNRNFREQKTYFFEYVLKFFSHDSLSTVIATEKHASLYEDIDHFLNNMLEIKGQVKNKIINDGSVSLQNLCFVANNLADYPFANVVLAAALCTTPFNEYPSGDFGPVVFDMDFLDIKENEIVYFKDNFLTGTTVENLVNFCRPEDPGRNILADRIKKYFLRELDFESFKGRLLTSYQRSLAEQKIIDFLEAEKNRTIEEYRLNPVGIFKDRPGSAYLHVEFEIVPINFKQAIAIRADI